MIAHQVQLLVLSKRTSRDVSACVAVFPCWVKVTTLLGDNMSHSNASVWCSICFCYMCELITPSNTLSLSLSHSLSNCLTPSLSFTLPILSSHPLIPSCVTFTHTFLIKFWEVFGETPKCNIFLPINPDMTEQWRERQVMTNYLTSCSLSDSSLHSEIKNHIKRCIKKQPKKITHTYIQFDRQHQLLRSI